MLTAPTSTASCHLKSLMCLCLQLSKRVAVRREKRWAAEAVQQALQEAKAQEQEQFELIKAEFGVDTATVR